MKVKLCDGILACESYVLDDKKLNVKTVDFVSFRVFYLNFGQSPTYLNTILPLTLDTVMLLHECPLVEMQSVKHCLLNRML